MPAQSKEKNGKKNARVYCVARGRTLHDARDALQSLASEVFDEERAKPRAHAGPAGARILFYPGLLTARVEVLD